MSDAHEWEQRVLACVVDGDVNDEAALRIACGSDDDRRAELALLDELGGLLDAPGVDAAARALAAATLERLGEPRLRAQPAPRPQRSSTWRRVGLIASGVTAMAVALLLVLVWAVPPRAVTPPVVTLATITGDVRVDGIAVGDAPVALTLGSVIEPGADATACLHFDPQIDACIDAQSSVRIAALDEAEIGLEVTRGRVVAALDPLPTGMHFRLMGGGMRATAVGTALSLEVQDGFARTAVLEGKVAVEADGQEQPLVAGEGASQRAGRLHVDALGADSVARDWSLLRRARLGDAQAHGEPSVDAQPAAAAAAIGAELPAASPTFTAPPPPVPDDQASVRTPTTKPPRRSAMRLLGDARAALGRGELREAARAYEDLIASHPRAAEAHAACVSLGDLYIGHLSNPRAATRWFRRYLADGGGSLAPEARHGLVRAARALGDEAGERAAIDAFVRAHPRDGRVATLRRRLTSLNTADP